MRRLRRSLTPLQQAKAAGDLAAVISSLSFVTGALKVGLYYPNDGEIDPSKTLAMLHRRGKTVYLPVLAPGRKARVLFAPFAPGWPLAPNKFGIPEPVCPRRQCMSPLQLDCIFLPLVAFDQSGGRLGMGGGYYDTSLEALKHRVAWHRPRLIGLAHHFQQVDDLAIDSWDVPLHGVVTDREFLDVRTTTGALD